MVNIPNQRTFFYRIDIEVEMEKGVVTNAKHAASRQEEKMVLVTG